MATQSQMKIERSARTTSPRGRASYPTLFVARAFKAGDEPKFSCTLMLEKSEAGDKYVEGIKGLRDQAVKALWGTKKPANLEVWGITDGDESEDTAMHGNWLIKATSKIKPAVVDLDKQPIMDAATVYGGCDIRMNFCAKAYGTSSKGGVTFELVAVQKVDDNQPFGGAERARADAVNEFGDDIPF